ncbi:hypothetical protein CYMTET_53829, partial [Cymbomonas tetramitiformis]
MTRVSSVTLNIHHLRHVGNKMAVTRERRSAVKSSFCQALPRRSHQLVVISQASSEPPATSPAFQSFPPGCAAAQKAAEVLSRDGFVVIEDAVSAEQLARLQGGVELVRLQEASGELIKLILEADPNFAGNRNIGRGGRRYSIGSIKQFPGEAWVDLVDYLVPTVVPLLDTLWVCLCSVHWALEMLFTLKAFASGSAATLQSVHWALDMLFTLKAFASGSAATLQSVHWALDMLFTLKAFASGS